MKFLNTLALFGLLFVTACAADTRKTSLQEAVEETPVEALYTDAANNMEAGEYAKAARLFDAVERQHPYSQWATKSQIMAAYAHYKNMKYDEAVIALDRFIQLHPGDKDIDYAYYLRALCYYEQISDVRRDQKMTELALRNLRTVVQRFPESRYAKDAGLKIDLTEDHLAGKEMEIGRYYLERGHFNAAINRFKTVIEEYQTTTHTPEALHRLVESYYALGILTEAQANAAVLGHNYPGSKWYEYSYKLLKGNVTPGEGTLTPEKKSMYDKTLGRFF